MVVQHWHRVSHRCGSAASLEQWLMHRQRRVHLMCCVHIFTLLVCSHLLGSGMAAAKCCTAVLGNVWERRRNKQSPAEVYMSP